VSAAEGGASARAAAADVFPVLTFFEHSHLMPHLQAVSAPYTHLAYGVAIEAMRVDLHGESFPAAAYEETNAGLRKLLEAKDCAVRAFIAARNAAARGKAKEAS